MRHSSIRRSLLIRNGIGVGALLCLLAFGTYLQVRQGLHQELDESIRQAAALLSNQIEYEDGAIIFEWQEGAGESGHLLSGVLFQYWNETTGETTRSPGVGSADLPRFIGRDDGREIRDIELPGERRHARALGMRVFPFILPEEAEKLRNLGAAADPRNIPHILVVARDVQPVDRVLARTRWILGSGTLLTLLVGYFLTEWAIRSSLRSIDELTDEVRARSGTADDQSLKLPSGLPAELSGLVENFDALLERVAAVRRREKDFIRHAAHELRTPIAGLRATTDLALSKPRQATEYVSQLESCAKTAQELTDLVQRLTALARMGNSTSPVRLEPIDLVSLVDECLQRFLPAMEQRDLRLHRIVPDACPRAIADIALCRIVFHNLLDNAVSYAPTGGEIVVRFDSRNGRVVLAVANTVEDAPRDPKRLFEPLFRHEESRRDSGAHLGIGLTLSLEAARSMNGGLSARLVDARRIEFTLDLPMAAQ